MRLMLTAIAIALAFPSAAQAVECDGSYCYGVNSHGALWDLYLDDWYLEDGSSDAYDGAGYITLETAKGSDYDFEVDKPSPSLDKSDTVVTSSTITMGDTDELEVYQVWYLSPDRPYARQSVFITNTGVDDVTYDLWWLANMGSDSDTTLLGSSSGDLITDATDSWVYSWDNGDGSDPYVGFIWGDGTLPIDNDPEYGEKNDYGHFDDDLELQWASLTFAGGSTVGFHFFYFQQYGGDDIADDIAATLLDVNAFFTGLTFDEILSVVNFDLSDLDGDGEMSNVLGGTDCDDGDATINTAAAEVCDEVDNNCDGTVDEGVTTTWYQDLDGDGYGDEETAVDECEAPDAYHVEAAGDCDDGDDDTYEGAAEICWDGEDNDCDGEIDEDCEECPQDTGGECEECQECSDTGAECDDGKGCSTTGAAGAGLAWLLGLGLAVRRRQRG